MVTLELAMKQLDACAKYFHGVWYLAATPFGYVRTTNREEAELYGILYTAGK